MKNIILIMMLLLVTASISPAEKMSAGAIYSEGFPNAENTAAYMFGAFFQYDFNEWLCAKADLGSLNIAVHEETEQSTQGFMNRSEFDLTANALPYISVRLLAYVPFTNGRVYFGPGYFTATAKGDGKYTETDTTSNFDIDVKKMVLSGISLTVGGSVNITDKFFLYGETMLVDAYEAEHEYEYSYPGQTYTLTETGKDNGGFASVGIGAGFMF